MANTMGKHGTDITQRERARRQTRERQARMGAEAAKVAAAVHRFVRRIDKTTKCQKCQNFLELCLENIKSCPAKLFPAQDSAVTGCPMLLPSPLVQLGSAWFWFGLVSFRFGLLFFSRQLTSRKFLLVTFSTHLQMVWLAGKWCTWWC